MKNRNKDIDAELAALARVCDEDVDTSDIPEVKDWSGAVRGKFFRPVKEAISLRIDADVLAWFKNGGAGYQTRINEVLRGAMVRAGSDTAPKQGGPAPEVEGREAAGRCRTFHYPSLERHGELHRCDLMATSIAERRSLFVPAK
jgi:uncharacterized protein (DUF4415 family)